VAAGTERIRIRICALLITLYDPIRLAEDLAVLDLLSRGRVFCVLGQGYRPIEFHALDKDWERRGERTDFILETLLQAWRGEPFDYRGQTIRVTPTPYSQPHPPILYGGMSAAAAKRAAKFGLPFFPPAQMPELEAVYHAELQRLGKQGAAGSPGADAALLFIDENPDRAWEELGPYFLREAREYGSWARRGVERPYGAGDITAAELRAQRRYEILTPAQCRQRIAAAAADYQPILHPLCGGVPVERAWHCLKLYVEQVLKPLGAA
jgi:alkanesulfonate monooxygenase SsuD/methylene tetrahydromethanopterin reductase-like flavin-dependent oxidoreductase (luciferase family)